MTTMTTIIILSCQNHEEVGGDALQMSYGRSCLLVLRLRIECATK
jgi:hypothetical protein